MIFNNNFNYFRKKRNLILEQENSVLNNEDIKQKCVKVINEEGIEKLEKQFKNRTVENFILVPIHENNPSIYHYWYDCYEDWPYEYAKDFIGWKIQDLKQLSNCRECKRCMERDYRNSHPKSIITGYNFHYYFEDL